MNPPPAPTGTTQAAWRHAGGEDLADVYTRLRRVVVHRLRNRWAIDQDNAEDLAQDAWTKALHGLPAFDTTARFEPWLFRIADRVAIDHLKKARDKHGRPRSTPTDDHAALDQPCPATHPLEDRELLSQAVSALPERQRQAVVLSLLEEHSAREAGHRLGLSENAFRQLLHRGCAALRVSLLAQGLRQVVFALNWLRDRRRAELVQPVLLSGGQLMVAASLAITAAVDTEHTAAKDLNATQATSAPPPATLLLGAHPSTATLAEEEPGHAAAPPAALRDTAPPRPTVVPLPTFTAPITGNRIHQDAYHDPDYDIGLAVPTPQGDRRSGIQIQDEQDHRPLHEALCLAADTAPIAYCDR